jgi:hypothetical protein
MLHHETLSPTSYAQDTFGHVHHWLQNVNVLPPIGNSIAVLSEQMINQHGLSTSSKALHSNITDVDNIIVILVVPCLVGKARNVGILICRDICRQEDQNHEHMSIKQKVDH